MVIMVIFDNSKFQVTKENSTNKSVKKAQRRIKTGCKGKKTFLEQTMETEVAQQKHWMNK